MNSLLFSIRLRNVPAYNDIYICVSKPGRHCSTSWWRHQMETFSALLALCAGNSPVTGDFPAQRPVTRSFDVFFDLCRNKRLSKQGWWFETLSCSLWRHCNVMTRYWTDSNPLLEQMLINRMAWQWAETLVEIRGTLADIRGTTK